MRLLAILFIVALARAATIVENPSKKVTQPIKDDQKLPLDNVDSEQELIDEANTVKDVVNNLRKQPQAIPVQVVVQPSGAKVALNEVGIDTDTDDVNIKRVEVDLKNPGPPQRIEHDNQNPEHFDDGQTSLDNINIKQDIVNTENNFNSNVQNIQESIQGWIASGQHFATIQKNFQAMKASIDAQIAHMNQTIQKFLVPAAANIQSVAEGAQQNIQAGLKTLERNVQSGMKILTEEIKSIGATNDGSVKSAVKQGETQNPEKPETPVKPGNNQWWNLQDQFNAFAQNVQYTIGNFTAQQNDIFANVQQTIFPPAKPAGAESDEPQRPNFWQGIQSFFQGQSSASVPVQNDPVQGSAPPKNPIVQAIQSGIQTTQNAIQNNPIVQGFQSIISPAQPAKPAETPAAEGSNVVPEKPADEKPEVQPALLQSGPIREAIGKNPIVQGLAGVAQRIQHTIRPTSPREADEQKGYHKPSASADEHNIDGNGVAVKRDSKPEPSQKEPIKADIPEKVDEKPANVEEKPAKVEEKPANVEEKPAKVEEKPANVEEKPAKVEEKPARIEEFPVKVEKKVEKV